MSGGRLAVTFVLSESVYRATGNRYAAQRFHEPRKLSRGHRCAVTAAHREL